MLCENAMQGSIVTTSAEATARGGVARVAPGGPRRARRPEAANEAIDFSRRDSVSEADPFKYAINFLTVGRRHILAIDGVSEECKAELQNHNVTAEWLDFESLKLGYRAAHCTTQVLLRSPA
jgi:hypothetical protein